MNRRARGFTLIELLTAIAIFALLAGMLFQMVKGALDVWRTGESGRESMEKGAVLLEEIAQELRMTRADSAPASTAPDVRMLADFGLFDLDANGDDESLLQRIRFVRSCPEERTDNRLRKLGDVPGGKLANRDVDPDAENSRAPGGLAEVGFATVALPGKDKDPAVLQLVRFYRTPIGGEESLFSANAAGWIDNPKKVLENGVALADGVLYLGFEFWSRDTKSFDKPANAPEGPFIAWDSTRAVLAKDGGSNAFPLAKGPESLVRGDDDVFPRRVRVTIVVERDSDEAQIVRLLGDVAPTANSVRVERPRGFESSLSIEKFLKIDGEWMRVLDASGPEIKVERGVRGTAKLGHSAGARVRVGRTFERVVDIPVYREDWNDP